MKLLKFLESKTSAQRSYGSNKFCFETIEPSNLDYYNVHKKEWIGKEKAETVKYKYNVDLTHKMNELNNPHLKIKPLFKYFLDGSRRAYKVDDVAYDNNIYPIVAGQIGVGCCQRNSFNDFKPTVFEMHNVISMPFEAYSEGYKANLFFNNLLQNINELPRLKKFNIKFSKILTYQSKEGKDKEDQAVILIQDEMIELEKQIVAELVSKNLLNDDNYLIKDGSLEYQNIGTSDKEFIKIKNNYSHVIGVSKKFNPEIVGDDNITKLADLKLYHRTPAIKYTNYSSGKYANFCIWYIRIREAKYSASPFDGIIKVEKILNTDAQIKNGIESSHIDHISAHLIKERNPVCYGSDERWANHLYPIHLTERFIKSRYLSDMFFLNLF